MIVQVADVVHFQGVSRIVVPLERSSTAGTILVLAVVTVCSSAALRVSDDLGADRWRQANRDAHRAFWYRHQSPLPGVTQIIAETPNALPITGRAVVAETAGVSAGDAVQLLSDLLLEAA